jgi:N-acetyl sugar amidotransferase
MDTSAMDITFDDQGICNYCNDYLTRTENIIFKEKEQRRMDLEVLIDNVKTAGHGKPYDCVIGVSGGVDSSWALVQSVKLGIRPLAVHMDNGWNSELAQNNIANIVKTLGVDLYTHVIDWNEYRNLMQAFFDADVIDVELLYDNAMLGVNYRQANKYGTKFLLSGSNLATEGMRTPTGWNWLKKDKKNIKAIGKRFGQNKLKTFPSFGTIEFIYFEFIKGIKWIRFLDYFEYNKREAMACLERDYGYKPYPYKHYESVFTRFYQGFILPRKFKVDKRRLHLGVLVASGQMSREEALRDLEGSPYPSEQQQKEDTIYFLKKMGWTTENLNSYLSRPEKPHDAYPSEKPFWDFSKIIYSFFNKERL